MFLNSFNWDESEISFPNGLLDALEPRSVGCVKDARIVWQINGLVPTFSPINPLPFFKGLSQDLFQQISEL